MKIWRTLENGYHRHYSSKRAAEQGVRAVVEAQKRGDFVDGCAWGAPCDGPELCHVPTDKVGLLKWLNEECYYTGNSPD